MAEAGHACLGIGAISLGERRARADPRFHEGLGKRRLGNLEEHGEHVLVRAAVPRPLERRDGRHHRRVEISHRGHRHARREGGGVELVVGVQREDHVQDARDLRGGLPSVEHVEEVRGVRAVGPRGHRLVTGADALPGGHRGRHQVHQPVGLAQVGGGLVGADVRIGGGGQRHRGAQGVQGVALARQPAQQVEHGRRQGPRLHEPRAELRALGRRRQLPEPEQPRGVLEAGRPDQVRDLVATVVEAPGLPVHPADRRPRRDDVLEPVLVRRRHGFVLPG